LLILFARWRLIIMTALRFVRTVKIFFASGYEGIYKLSPWFYVMIILEIGFFVLMGLTRRIVIAGRNEAVEAGGFARKPSGGLSYKKRCMPKHLQAQVEIEGTQPRAEEYENLLYESHLQEYLREADPSSALFNGASQKIYTAFNAVKNSSGIQRFRYIDGGNDINGYIQISGKTMNLDIMINM